MPIVQLESWWHWRMSSKRRRSRREGTSEPALLSSTSAILQQGEPAQQRSPLWMGSEAWVGRESHCESGSLELAQMWVFLPPPSPPRATSNSWVRETVALELSYVNSNLQLLKEELAELSSSVDVDQPEGCEMPGGARTRVEGAPGWREPQARAPGRCG